MTATFFGRDPTAIDRESPNRMSGDIENEATVDFQKTR